MKKNTIKNSDNNCDFEQKLLPVDEALDLLEAKARPVTAKQTIPLTEALGRVLANDVISTINVPPADNSAMDGFAVNSQDLITGQNSFEVSQRIPAGHKGHTLKRGTAARIFTGAPIPDGADVVVMQEACTLLDEKIMIEDKYDSGTNIRKRGEDIEKGNVILTAGKRLKAQDLGLAASVGCQSIEVYRRLKVAIFSTGDELREPGETLAEGQIYNSNRYTLRGLLSSLGCEVMDLGIVKDTLESTKKTMLEAAENADLVMTSGGVSVGEEDHIRTALEKLGQLQMWRLNIKPGKPLAFGQIKHKKGKTPFLGLPGNPVSVFATFHIIARVFILRSQGILDTRINKYKVASGFTTKHKGSRLEYLRAKLETDVDGEQQVVIYPNQSSGVLTSASWADGFVIIPAQKLIKIGDMLEFIPFTEFSTT